MPETGGATVAVPDNAVISTDVLIVGSGPIGATYARKLVDANIKVLMIDIGEQSTRLIGDHKKNSLAVQKDISLFTSTVKGELSLLSVPVDKQAAAYLEPVSWSPPPSAFIKNGQNPDQQAYDNLAMAAATRTVGGMGSHWTCCTPEQLPGVERSELFTEQEWKELYAEAKRLMWTNTISYEKSIRHQLVKHVLQDSYDNKRTFESMPLACKRSEQNPDYVEWASTASILGDLADPKYDGRLFELRAQHQCERVLLDGLGKNVTGVLATDLLKNTPVLIKAKKYVICAGATLTPGILYKSGFRAEEHSLPALGHYLTEQTMAFCQIVLKRSLVDLVKEDPYHLGWKKIVEEHHRKFPKDPLPFPFNDPDPQVYTPISKEYPWHTQIHRDAFGYGAVPSDIDQRLVVDFRWFGYVAPTYDNFVDFSTEVTDGFGMPQPTYHYRIGEEDADRTHRMMKDMVDVASHLGGFLPGAPPVYLAPGSALHVCGTCRAGTSKSDSVVDKNGKVWGLDDLYIGGCSVIPTQNATNPTITACCFALMGAKQIIEEMKRK